MNWEFIWGWNWATITGFAGVILTLVVNAKVARFQQERQWAADRRALRTGLIIELQSLSATLEESIKSLDDHVKDNKESGEQRHVMGLKLQEAHIVLASLTHLGRLTDSEAKAVFQAHNALVTQWRKAQWLSIRITEEAHIIPAKSLSDSRDILNRALPLIEKALKELRKNQDQ